ASFKECGMGSRAAGQTLLRAWLSWLRSGFLLRLIGLPAALLAIHLEVYGSSPAATSLILHRLSRRLRLRSLICMLNRDHATGLNNLSFLGGADVMDHAQSQHKPNPNPLSRKRSMTLDDKDRARPGPSGGSSTRPPISSPQHLPPSPASTLPHPSPRIPMPSHHARSMSHADAVRQGKRLSLQFPIQPAAGSSSPGFSPRSRPQSWRNELRKVTQLQPLDTTLANFRPDQDDEDGSSIWMQREMERRKALLSGTKQPQRKVFSGSRHLRTLSLLSPDKAYSPSFPQPLDIRSENRNELRPDDTVPRPRPRAPTRHTTSPDIANEIANTVTLNGDNYDLGGLSNIQRDAILRTGKQMATDFKDGLLTFIEDIRQATVGEEAVNGVDPAGSASARGPSAKGSRKPSDSRPTLSRAASARKPSASKTGDIGDDFWKEHGLSEPKSAPVNKKTHTLKNQRTPQKQTQAHKIADDFDDWDNWDTPNDKHAVDAADGSNSSDESDAPSSPVSGPNSSRTSTRYHSKRHDSKASSLTRSSSMGPADDFESRDSKRNSIPWPDLVKLSPTHLKRTASHLMKEWEKNLTPPPESRDAHHSTGDYVGRSASPAGLNDDERY
ncbi:hypothetical protein BS50DRAFT_480609, partial [Corynespora cassiicola Philippines]